MTPPDYMKKTTKLKQYQDCSLMIGDQLVKGIFIRDVKKWGFLKRYEFLVKVHVRDYNYGSEYDTKKIFAVKESDIIL